MNNSIFSLLICLILFSCSSSDTLDNSLPNNKSLVLVNQATKTTRSDDSAVLLYEYDGNKLIKITVENVIEKVYILFTYQGDLITKIESFNENNEIVDYSLIIYTNDKLTRYSNFKKAVLKYNEDYIYNTDGSVDVIGTKYTYDGGVISSYQNKMKIYYDAAGNRLKTEEFWLWDSPTKVRCTTHFIYDNKNNPFKNVIGYNKLPYGVGFDYVFPYTDNNEIKMTSECTDFVMVVDRIYQYNSQDYPISFSYTINGEDPIIWNYYYTTDSPK